MMNRLLLTLALLAPAGSVASYRYEAFLDVRFEPGGESLLAPERGKIIDFAQKGRDAHRCFQYALVWGYADRSEGSPEATRELAKRRATYVARLLSAYGLSPVQVQEPNPTTASGCGGKTNTCVQVDMLAWWKGASTCM